MLSISNKSVSNLESVFTVLLLKVSEAGLQISLGIGLRLFKLLEHVFQLLDLDIALLTFEQERTITQQRLIVLLETAQQLENEADAMREEAERHQEVIQWYIWPLQSLMTTVLVTFNWLSFNL